ncbi:MAG: hypothetical protein ACLUCS_15750, partial [Anaerotruncus colihominis]
MKIKCGTCGKSYDYARDETCPRCGAHNRPPRGDERYAYEPAGTPESAYRDLYALMRQTGRRTRLGPRSLTLAAVLMLMISLTLVQ